jgi:predicted transcriptional regulator
MRAPRTPPEQLTILAELSAWRPGFGQTWAVTHPTDVDVHIGPERIGGLTLPDAPCDARGVLSGIAGRPCKYGYRVELTVKGAKLANALGRAGETPVRFRVRESAENVGGLGLFLRGGGRYPLGPTVVCE